MRLRRLAGILVGLLALARPALASVACEARVRVEPERAVVGEPVLYALVIDQRKDVGRVRLEPSPAFPSFRSDWLPTVNRPDPDEGHRRYEERRALHPAHAGRLRIPGLRVVCSAPEGEHVAAVAASFVEVREVPAEGRPADWEGLVGPVALSRTVDARRVALGGSIRVGIRIAGAGNLWVADPGLDRALDADVADVFARRPELERDAGRVLELRRYHRYDVVPRKLGPLELPGLRIPFFDPARGAFDHATLPALTIEVVPATAEGDEQASPREASTPRTTAPRESVPGWARGFLIGVTALLAASAVGLWARRRPREVSPWLAVESALDEGRDACDRGLIGDGAGALQRALRVALKARHPGLEPDVGHAVLRERLSTDEEALAWVGLLERLERARFAREPDAAEIRSALAEATERLGRARADAE